MKSFVSIIFSFLFACLVICCAMQPLGDLNEDASFIDVVYSADGKSLTIYLEGGAPQTSRALTSAMAQMKHDFFEVVFEYEDDANNVYVARASWELGQSVGINGVFRNLAGVDYSTVDGDISGLPAGVTAGKAVLFAGTKADKTLLGVGRLTAADGVNNAPVKTNTRTITFEVAALKAGVDFDANDSSFSTSGTTTIEPMTFLGSDTDTGFSADKEFPVFMLPAGGVPARYKIDVSNADFNDYIAAIRVSGDGKVIDKNDVNYTTGFRHQGQRWRVKDDFLNNDVLIEMNNNKMNNVFNNNIDFSFSNYSISAADVKIASFTFEIPVYAVNYNVFAGIPNSINWFIRPGINPFNRDFDDGQGGIGGSILIGTGVSDEIDVVLDDS
ncbi:MAG: hypothetical protein FWC21_03335 [Treponema sp.]|nr:hypothetical protein [Treponema sp.]